MSIFRPFYLILIVLRPKRVRFFLVFEGLMFQAVLPSGTGPSAFTEGCSTKRGISYAELLLQPRLSVSSLTSVFGCYLMSLLSHSIIYC